MENMELTLFNHEKFGNIRAMTKDGEPWFVGKDIANVLGYVNPTKAIKAHVDDEDKVVSILDTSFGEKETYFINESGMYSLVLGSKLPEAKSFKRWVTAEVLPSIRKHGIYGTKEWLIDTINHPEKALETIQELYKEINEREKIIAVKNQQLSEAKPKVDYYDTILSCKDAINVSVIAKDYGMTAKDFNLKLHELGVQFYLGKTWLLYSKYQDCGYTKTETFVKDTEAGTVSNIHTKWTQKGRCFLYNLLKENDIVPIVEQ